MGYTVVGGPRFRYAKLCAGPMAAQLSLTLCRYALFTHNSDVLHAPYFIFIRCGDELTDADILEEFGLQGYQPVQTVPRLGVYAILADDGEWTLLADCWFYLLWHNKSTGPTIERLAATFDVFACSVGDSDDSFDFVYYRDGKLVRKYVVTDPHYQGGAVTDDIGEPLPSESDILKDTSDKLTMVLAIASSLGIKTNYSEAELRTYERPLGNASKAV